jgi:DNA-binding transcriptional LysR family regulator
MRVLSQGSEPLVAAVRSDRIASTITLDELASRRLLTLPRDVDPALYDTIVALFNDADLAPTLAVAAEPRVESLLLAVAGGGGTALLPASAAARHAPPGVRIVDIDDAEPEIEAGITSHPHAEHLALHTFLHVVSGVVKRAQRRTPLLAAA